MKAIRIFGLLVLIALIQACGNLRIKAYQTYQAPAKAENIAVVGFYLAPPVLPKMPAQDAKTFKKKVAALQEDLNKELAESLGDYYNTLASGLELQLGLNTIHGEELASRPRYSRIKQKEDREGLLIHKKNLFPSVLYPESGLQLFELEKGDLKTYIDESPRLRSAVKSACKSLNTELVAFAYGGLVIDKVTTYGSKANIRLLVDIYLYNDSGVLAGHAYGETEPVTVEGSALSDYTQVLDQYSALQGEILTALTFVEEEEVDED